MADEALGNESQQPGAAQGGQGNDDKVTITRTELEAMRRETAEARESERYWAERARGNGGGRQPQAESVIHDDGPQASEFLDDEPATEIEGDTPEKLIDEFAASGVKALAKRGFITASDAKKIAVEAALHVSQEMIGRERQKLGTDQQIMSEFPELRDQTSELFKATAQIYQRAVKMDPNATKSPAALYLAAEAARESLRGRRSPEEEEDRGYRREREEDRRARVAAQDGRSNGKQAVDDGMDMLGPEAKEVARLMGITDKEFRDSRKELIRPRRR